MKKTKLGISVAMFGMLVCLLAGFGGYVVLGIALGYVLLVEDNLWLRRNTIKICLLVLITDFLCVMLGLVPDTISFIDGVLNIFKGSLHFSKLNEVIRVLQSGIGLIQKTILVLIAVRSINQGTVRIKFIDNLLDKHIINE